MDHQTIISDTSEATDAQRNALEEFKNGKSKFLQVRFIKQKGWSVYDEVYEQMGYDSPHKAKVAYHAWRRKVYKLTNENPLLHTLEHYDRRAYKGKDAYHLDHIKSMWKCWLDGDSIESAAHISNLQMLPAKKNIAKGPR